MEVSITAEPVAVTVYPDRARVTSVGHCELQQGLHRINIGDLPLTIDTESLRAGGAGNARVRLRSVDVARRHYAAAPSAQVKALEEQIVTLEARLQALDDDQAIKRASIAHLNGLRNATTEFASGLARGRTTPENQAALMRFLEDEESRLRAKLRELAVTVREVNDELDRLRRELGELQPARPRQRYEAQIDVEVLAAGDFAPEISYVVRNAGWRPLYDIRLSDADAGDISLTAIAEVTQDTGQDWTGISLTVSTARPALNQRLPDLDPWFIDAFQPQPRMTRAMSKAMEADALEMPAMADSEQVFALAAMPVQAELVTAEAQDSGSAVTFKVSGSVDIPGDGTPHKTTINQHSLPMKPDFLAVPRHTDAVYRRAKVVNATGAALLPGAASLYVGDEYIGQNRLDYTPASAEFELVLGVEERVTVKRELVRREVDKRLLRDVRQVAFGYEITLENLRSVPTEVTVRDQYPVTRHEQIKVRVDRLMPEPVEQSDLHIVEWRLNLKPVEKQTIRMEFQVEHPSALRVAGLLE